MEKNLVDIVMNPVRQRILQFFVVKKSGTVNDICSELTDIPRPSLYRHIKILQEAGLIEVISEKMVRGTMERTYALTTPKAEDYSKEDIAVIIQSTLLSLMASFGEYFKKPEADPMKDCLSISTSTVFLSDEEFISLMQSIAGLFSGILNNKPVEGRKERHLTIISSPNTKEESL